MRSFCILLSQNVWHGFAVSYLLNLLSKIKSNLHVRMSSDLMVFNLNNLFFSLASWCIILCNFRILMFGNTSKGRVRPENSCSNLRRSQAMKWKQSLSCWLCNTAARCTGWHVGRKTWNYEMKCFGDQNNGVRVEVFSSGMLTPKDNLSIAQV